MPTRIRLPANVKVSAKADVLGLMTKFNNDDIPQEGVILLLDAQMYSQLLNIA